MVSVTSLVPFVARFGKKTQTKNLYHLTFSLFHSILLDYSLFTNYMQRFSGNIFAASYTPRYYNYVQGMQMRSRLHMQISHVPHTAWLINKQINHMAN